MSNLIQFPKENKRILENEDIPLSVEEIQENMNIIKEINVQETIQTVCPILFQNLSIAGFDINVDDEDESMKDGAFIVEAIKSVLMEQYGLWHPFQNVKNEIFIKNDDCSLRIPDKLDVSLKEDEIKVNGE